MNIGILLNKLETSVMKFRKSAKKSKDGSFTEAAERLLVKIETNIILAKRAVMNKDSYFVIGNIDEIGKSLLRLERENIFLAKKETFVEMEDIHVDLTKLCKKLK